MSDITTSGMDNDVDYYTSEISSVAESGISDTMSVLLDANRPIRPNLLSLIQPGIDTDYTEAQFSAIHDIITTDMNADFDLPTGTHGAWGAAMNYASEHLEATAQWSFDDFSTLMSSHAITDIEYIISSGIPSTVPLGANDDDAGTPGRGEYDIRVTPTVGITTELDNLLGLEGHGWDNIDQIYGRLKATVNDCFGNPLIGEYVSVDTTGDVLITNAVGIVTFEVPAQTLDITSLRGSSTKTAVITGLEETELSFSYTGFVVTVLNGYNIPVSGTSVLIEEVDGDEQFILSTNGEGVTSFNNLQLNTNYKITVLNYYRSCISGAEGMPMYFLLSENNLDEWTPPDGYPTTVGNVVIYVSDYDTRRAIDGLKLKAYDDDLIWSFESHIGRGAVILPASDETPLTFTLEIIGASDRRYKGLKETITLEESENRVIEKYLHRREARSTY